MLNKLCDWNLPGVDPRYFARDGIFLVKRILTTAGALEALQGPAASSDHHDIRFGAARGHLDVG